MYTNTQIYTQSANLVFYTIKGYQYFVFIEPIFIWSRLLHHKIPYKIQTFKDILINFETFFLTHGFPTKNSFSHIFLRFYASYR